MVKHSNLWHYELQIRNREGKSKVFKNERRSQKLRVHLIILEKIFKLKVRTHSTIQHRVKFGHFAYPRPRQSRIAISIIFVLKS